MTLNTRRLPRSLTPLLDNNIRRTNRLPLHSRNSLKGLIMIRPSSVGSDNDRLLNFNREQTTINVNRNNVHLFNNRSLTPNLKTRVLQITPSNMPLPPRLGFRLRGNKNTKIHMFTTRRNPVPRTTTKVVMRNMNSNVRRNNLTHTNIANSGMRPTSTRLLRQRNNNTYVKTGNQRNRLRQSRTSSSFRVLSVDY